jgi:hypothetical protein
MNDAEFDDQAAAIAAQIRDLPPETRIPAACRGSGNPAALSWLAENLGFGAGLSAVDIGAGLGGPAAWLVDRYSAALVGAEPAVRAASAAVELFAVPTVCAVADRLPFRTRCFDAALLLGVVSVVDDAPAVLAEARRVAGSIGVMDYCSTGDDAVLAGGSNFVTAAALVAEVEAAGWQVEQTTDLTVPDPVAWTRATEAVEVPPEPTEEEVARAIAAGAIAPFLLVGR